MRRQPAILALSARPVRRGKLVRVPCFSREPGQSTPCITMLEDYLPDPRRWRWAYRPDRQAVRRPWKE